VRVDFDSRQLFCSVHDLIEEPSLRRFGLERGDGFRRMWLGQDIHIRRADLRAGEDPNYRAEVWVSHRLTQGQWDITISGRIDGLSVDRKGKQATIEEVKSLHFDLELEALTRSPKLQRHLFQLMLYAWFLSLQPEYEGYAFHPQLVLIDLISDRTETVPSAFEPGEVARAFDAALEQMVSRLESERALRMAKRAAAEEMEFPYPRLRPFQQDMVQAVARAAREGETLLVSAPTGVGKTIAAIYPALREALRTGKKLFFLTPKVLQQEMAVRTLKMLNDGSFRTLRIRAKQKMCAHTEMICHGDFCPFADRYAEKMDRSNLRARLVNDLSYFDPDITYELSRSTEVCPFEVSLELIEESDVIVCDYNYIFDPYVGLKAYQQDHDYSDCILIIDEAHNLLDRGRGYYSPELHEKDLQRVTLFLAARPGCELEGSRQLLEEMRDHLHTMAAVLGEQSGPVLCEPSARLFARQRLEWERLLMQYIGWKIENGIAEEEDPLVDFYFKLLKVTRLLGEDGEEFATLIEKTAEGLKLKVFCKDPSRFLGEILASAHAVVAMSATLEPFDFYRATLGFPEKRTFELSLPSPFPRENRKIVIVPEVDTTYRERALHYDTIAQRVAEMANASEGNFLVLFPSYAFLQQVSAKLPLIGKNVMVQRAEMSDYERKHLLEVLREETRQNVILAVAGGMYAEGIDYQGEMLSGVFIVGPALPTVSFEQELLRDYYDQRYGAGFEYAYLIPGMTRVVQSAGRVIRSETDVGVIALLCRRFTSATYNRFFPREWYEKAPRELVSRQPAEEIRAFFEAKRTPQLRLL
jgi:DNA excision repair protein ERCC-2